MPNPHLKRVPYAELPKPLQPLWEAAMRDRDEATFIEAAGNAPELLDWYYNGFYAHIFNGGRVDNRLKQLVRMKLSTVHGCAFCNRGNRLAALKAGVTEAQIDALDDVENGPFDAAERACLRLAEEVAASLASAAGHLSAEVEQRAHHHPAAPGTATVQAPALAVPPMQALRDALEACALRSLFAFDVEAAMHTVWEYEMLRHPIMSMVHFFADRQLEAAKAALHAAKAAIGANPLANPREVLCGVLRDHASPEVAERFDQTFASLEAWWGQQTKHRMPGPSAGEPAPIAYELPYDDGAETASAA